MDPFDAILWIVGPIVALLIFSRLLRTLDSDLTTRVLEVVGMRPESLAGKVVWVTGASSGIGQALAVELAQAGCRLVLSARREDRLKQTRQLCLDSSPSLRPEDILVLPLDLVDFGSHAVAVETVIKYFKQIDILVNNAGRSQRGLFEQTPLEVDKHLFDVDMFAPISLTKAVLPFMIARGQGHFVITSSVSGKFGAPGQAAYSGAKHALQGYFDALRIEAFIHHIKVTMVCPGPVHSEALLHAFTPTPGEKLEVTMRPDWGRMTAERCARLMAVAMANDLDEVWLTKQPELLYLYLFQYMPYIARRVAPRLGQTRVNLVRQGAVNLRGNSPPH